MNKNEKLRYLTKCFESEITVYKIRCEIYRECHVYRNSEYQLMSSFINISAFCDMRGQFYEMIRGHRWHTGDIFTVKFRISWDLYFSKKILLLSL